MKLMLCLVLVAASSAVIVSDVTSLQTTREVKSPGYTLAKDLVANIIKKAKNYNLGIVVTFDKQDSDFCIPDTMPIRCVTSSTPAAAVHLPAAEQPLYLFISGSPTYHSEMLKLAKSIRHQRGSGDPIVFIYQEIDVNIQSYLKQKMYNMFFFVPNQKLDTYLVYEVCQFCNKGEDDVVAINKWSTMRGFGSELSFPRSFKGTFFGKVLRMACSAFVPPIIFKTGIDEAGNIIADGYEYNTLMFVKDYLDFIPKLVVPTDGKWGQLVNGNLTGTLGLLTRGEVEMGGCVTGVTAFRRKYVDMSIAIFMADDVIISAKPQADLKWYSLFTPFGFVIWGFTLSCIISSALIIYISDRKLYYISDRKASGFSLWDDFYGLIQILFWDSSVFVLRSGKTMIVLLCFMNATAILVNYYLADLTASMTTVLYSRPPIDKSSDIIKYDMEWMAIKGSTFSRLYDFQPELKKRRKYIKNILAMGKMTAENPDHLVYVMADKMATGINEAMGAVDKYGLTRLHYSKIKLGQGPLIWQFPKKSNYQSGFNNLILIMKETGIMTKLEADGLYQSESKAKKKAKLANRVWVQPSSEYVSMKHLTGLFGVSGVVYLIAAIIFAVENLIGRLRKSSKINKEETSTEK